MYEIQEVRVIKYCTNFNKNYFAGDVVCDPMCGGGSISIEGALNWHSCVHLCGDNHDLAPPRVLSNVLNIVKETKDKKQVQTVLC